jgi:hypothetical protein
MSITNRLRLLGTLCAFIIFSEAFSQSSASSYTSLGIGEFNYGGLTQNQAMGGLGISFGTGWGVNYMNPALSTRNTIFNFQAAFNYNRLDVTSAGARTTIDGGGLSYAAFSLPIKSGKSTLGLGLNQISSVNYNILVNGEVNNSDYDFINRIDGGGGVSEAYLSGGFTVAKNLSIGLHGSYLFGSTIRTNQLSLINNGVPTGISTEYYQRFTVSDVSFKTGVYYFFKMGKRSNLHLGAIYNAFGNINGKNFAKIAEFGQASRPDTDGDVLSNNVRGAVYVPQNVGFGISYEKINKFVIGLEAQRQDFTQYRTFEGNSSSLGENIRVALGGQIVPDYLSVENFLKRSTLRFGVYFQQTPYVVNQTNINDIGINFGASVPVNSLSLLNFSVKVGRRGTTENGLLQENFLGFSLGFSLNDNTWFYKRVFE